MIRFYQHIKKYLELPPEVQSFIQEHGYIRHGNKNEYFVLQDQHAPHWGYVLEGLIAGHSFDADGNRTIHYVVQEGDYFTGNKHLHSDESCKQNIEFFKNSEVLVIPIDKMRYAQKQFPEINELIHRFKQHKILQKDRLINILKQKDLKLRYFKFMDDMGNLAGQLTVEQRRDFIQISEAHYKKVNRAYSRRKIISFFF